MKSYIMKKTKRICSVPGCGAKESYLLSRSKDLTGSIFLCKECIAAAAALDSAINGEKAEKKPKAKDGGKANEKAGA